MVDACAAAGILPFYGPFGDIRDVEGCEAQFRAAYLMGCVGTWSLHPAQIDIAEGLLARPGRGRVRAQGDRGDPRRPRRAHDRRQDAGRRHLEAVQGDGRARRDARGQGRRARRGLRDVDEIRRCAGAEEEVRQVPARDVACHGVHRWSVSRARTARVPRASPARGADSVDGPPLRRAESYDLWCSCSAPPSLTTVPSGPAGAGMVNLPGTFVPGTPFTDSVEYAYVSTANATASALIVERVRLLLAMCRRPRGSRGRTRLPRCRPRAPLLGGLELLGAGEQAAGRDAVVDERLVVAATAELAVLDGSPAVRVELLEDVLDRRGARRDDDGRREARLVPVVDHGCSSARRPCRS